MHFNTTSDRVLGFPCELAVCNAQRPRLPAVCDLTAVLCERRLGGWRPCALWLAAAIVDQASRGQAMDDRIDPADVYFEFTFIGAAARVAAIDATTGVEITVIGPARAARADLERLALAKLARGARSLANDQKRPPCRSGRGPAAWRSSRSRRTSLAPSQLLAWAGRMCYRVVALCGGAGRVSGHR